ncbi:MAG TPA: phosphoribosylformylglycinamidine cyclo-ligase [Thermoplasmatales archaeon]|nr:phosphoribosylformylglycinamidine cyclo-ligase [Thermoplasmatales archaeon]
MEKMSYAKSGVDIFKEEKAIKGLISNISYQRKGIGKPLGGEYAGLIDFGEYALVLCTDGVGSKIKIANELKKWDTIGIDCIAMNVNDAICVGAEPIAFVDYLAIDNSNPNITAEIGKGLAEGAKKANISIVGGETATLPEIINGLDLAGTCLGYVKKNQIISGEKITPGDVIIGLSSSGLHSNGFTLARKIIEKKGYSYHDEFPHKAYKDKTIGEVMLTPTRIYVKEILALLKTVEVHGLAHITGGGMRNLLRLKKDVSFTLNNLLEPQPIFSFLQEKGNVENKEMYQTFNMGTGFMVITPEKEKKKALEILKKHSEAEVKIIGEIEKGEGVHLPELNIHYS